MRMRRGMTTGRGTTVARVFSAASGAVLVAVLAGCSLGDTSGSDPAGSPASASAEGRQPTDQALGPDHNDPPAFHFKSGDLILGDFTYEEVAGNIFNPCEEISAEEFAAIGFETDGRVQRSHSKDVNACPITANGALAGLEHAIMGGSANLLDTVNQGGFVETGVSELIQGAYSYGPIGVNADICYTAVDTNRGQLSVGVGGISSSFSDDELCDRSLKILEALYKLK